MTKQSFSPILLIDNEYENVSALEDILKLAAAKAFPQYRGKLTEYVESAADAVEVMIEAMRERKGYSAIISDNHLGDIYGEDFLRLMNGQALYCISKKSSDLRLDISALGNFEAMLKLLRKRDDDIYTFLKSSFKNIHQYRKFVNYYTDEVNLPYCVLFCGNPREADLTGLTIPTIQKGEGCEYEVLESLEEAGIFESEHIDEALVTHRRFSPTTNKNKRKYNPGASEIKRKKKKISKKKK